MRHDHVAARTDKQMKKPAHGGFFRHYRLSSGGGLRPQVPWLVFEIYSVQGMASIHDRATIDAVRAALSPARMGSYEAAACVIADDDPAALVLYAWNAEVSGALLAPLHVCEVVIRNAVADAVEAVYGKSWPWSTSFEQSLPDPPVGYSPRKDLQIARKYEETTGKVIPELSFVFWQKMFTGRHDTRLWAPHLKRVLPGIPREGTIAERRHGIYRDLEQVRKLRNRIAHHEPIFGRALGEDYGRIRNLVAYRCAITAEWLHQNQTATKLIQGKPYCAPAAHQIADRTPL